MNSIRRLAVYSSVFAIVIASTTWSGSTKFADRFLTPHSSFNTNPTARPPIDRASDGSMAQGLADAGALAVNLADLSWDLSGQLFSNDFQVRRPAGRRRISY